MKVFIKEIVYRTIQAFEVMWTVSWRLIFKLLTLPAELYIELIDWYQGEKARREGKR